VTYAIRTDGTVEDTDRQVWAIHQSLVGDWLVEDESLARRITRGAIPLRS
jgi:hypothetical protein